MVDTFYSLKNSLFFGTGYFLKNNFLLEVITRVNIGLNFRTFNFYHYDNSSILLKYVKWLISKQKIKIILVINTFMTLAGLLRSQ